MLMVENQVPHIWILNTLQNLWPERIVAISDKGVGNAANRPDVAKTVVTSLLFKLKVFFILLNYSIYENFRGHVGKCAFEIIQSLSLSQNFIIRGFIWEVLVINVGNIFFFRLFFYFFIFL